MKKLITLGLASVFFISCNTKVEPPKEIKVKDLYTIEVSSTLAEITDLQPEASLQYGNKFKELYIVAIDEDKNTFNQTIEALGKKGDLASYEAEVLSHYTGTKNYELLNQKDLQIDGHNAKLLDIKANVQGIDIYYKIGIVEGKANYYRIISWTLEKYKDAQNETMEKMILSFKEL
ncbi:hypothetical protein [Myroides guanonis]|nr:hypothetical protein [Myroides guanonis]